MHEKNVTREDKTKPNIEHLSQISTCELKHTKQTLYQNNPTMRRNWHKSIGWSLFLVFACAIATGNALTLAETLIGTNPWITLSEVPESGTLLTYLTRVNDHNSQECAATRTEQNAKDLTIGALGFSAPLPVTTPAHFGNGWITGNGQARIRLTPIKVRQITGESVANSGVAVSGGAVPIRILACVYDTNGTLIDSIGRDTIVRTNAKSGEDDIEITTSQPVRISPKVITARIETRTSNTKLPLAASGYVRSFDLQCVRNCVVKLTPIEPSASVVVATGHLPCISVDVNAYGYQSCVQAWDAEITFTAFPYFPITDTRGQIVVGHDNQNKRSTTFGVSIDFISSTVVIDSKNNAQNTNAIVTATTTTPKSSTPIIVTPHHARDTLQTVIDGERVCIMVDGGDNHVIIDNATMHSCPEGASTSDACNNLKLVQTGGYINTDFAKNADGTLTKSNDGRTYTICWRASATHQGQVSIDWIKTGPTPTPAPVTKSQIQTPAPQPFHRWETGVKKAATAATTDANEQATTTPVTIDAQPVVRGSFTTRISVLCPVGYSYDAQYAECVSNNTPVYYNSGRILALVTFITLCAFIGCAILFAVYSELNEKNTDPRVHVVRNNFAI